MDFRLLGCAVRGLRLRGRGEVENEYELTKGILALSEASKWDEARLEWELDEIRRKKTPEICLCGHTPINELCILQNRKNGKKTIVGNVCVKKFMKLNFDKLFSAIRRVEKDAEKALNPDVVDYAHGRGWLNDWERSFYLDTWRKKSPTKAQMRTRLQLNRRVLSRVSRDVSVGKS